MASLSRCVLQIFSSVAAASNNFYEQVGSDDKLEDVQEAAREIFQVPDGVLHMPSVVTNNADLQLPVTSWGHFIFLTEPATSKREFERLRTTDMVEQRSRQTPEPPKVNLVLVGALSSTVVCLESVIRTLIECRFQLFQNMSATLPS